MRKLYTSRRDFLSHSLYCASLGSALTALPLPAWAAKPSGVDRQSAREWNLTIADTAVTIAGRDAIATTIGDSRSGGSLPAPLLRFREGERVTLNVRNELSEDSSIHWHGLLLPTDMDGVPGLSFPGIRPGESYRYQFDVRQSGTYWYHSHSGLQEQTGMYGPLVIDPAGEDPVASDREFIVLLSDWTFEDPYRVLSNLKMADDYYNDRRRAQNPFDMWAAMRMSPTDIADVTALTYTFLMNGRDAAANWTGVFNAGERLRLRFINGSAMSFFNVRIPGVTMTVVAADGQNVEPVDVEEFQIGTAETYDVVVEPQAGAWTIMAESMDRSGYVRGTLTTQPGLTAEVPPLRTPPRLSMMDMGMHHGGGGHHQHAMQRTEHNHRRGPGVANVAEMTMSRLDHPGIGLEDVEHKALCYADLKSLERNVDTREPGRTLELHLTGNMHRYMWSFDGYKYSEVKGPIEFKYGERLRMVLVNDTMMSHPIHLHGMFVELVNGNGSYNPRKHTIVVKPAERLCADISATEPGLWAFHCHLLYHMKAGMMRAVRVA